MGERECVCVRERVRERERERWREKERERVIRNSPKDHDRTLGIGLL